MPIEEILPGASGSQSASVAADNPAKIKALVGDRAVTDAGEKCGLNWHGKRLARQLALAPSTGTLRPCPDESPDWGTTKNLMIEGENRSAGRRWEPGALRRCSQDDGVRVFTWPRSSIRTRQPEEFGPNNDRGLATGP